MMKVIGASTGIILTLTRTTTVLLLLLLGTKVVSAAGSGSATTTKADYLRRKLQPSSSTTCDPADYDYPDGLNAFTGDPGVSMYTAIISGVTPGIRGIYETPIAIRAFALIDAASWGCMAAYDTNKLDALRIGSRPIIEVPPTLSCDGTNVNTHNTGARAMCFAHVYSMALPTFSPESLQGLQEAFVLLSTDFTTTPPSYNGAFPSPFPTELHPDIQACDDIDNGSSYDDFKVCVNDVAVNHNYKPEIVASALTLDMLKYALEDGFNMDGSNNGECEYNCRPYSDTTGYVPVNVPMPSKDKGKKNREKKEKEEEGGHKTRQLKDNDKNKERWEPLLEDDGRGFFYRQEHVTPHIGFTAKPRTISPEELASRELDDPNYDLVLEAQKVTDRMASTLEDDVKKMMIEFFDDKTNLAGLLGQALAIRYQAEYTLERIFLYLVSYTAVEYDTVLLAWKEKVRHDLVRTTTVIQQTSRYDTPDTITTWAGPNNGIQTFAARDFQPYIRVMPHSEYPSGSGCICTGDIESTQAFMKLVYNDDISIDDPFFAFAPFTAGQSKAEPGVTPATDFVFPFTSLRDIRDTCGESRLDGGMHFEASVPDSYDLCGGLGQAAEDYILYLLNGTTDLITTYVPSGPPGEGGGGGGPPPGVGGGGVGGGPPPGIGGGVGGGPPPGVGGGVGGGPPPGIGGSVGGGPP